MGEEEGRKGDRGMSTRHITIMDVQRLLMKPRERLAAVCSLVPQDKRGADPLCQLLAHLGVTIPPDPNAEPARPARGQPTAAQLDLFEVQQ